MEIKKGEIELVTATASSDTETHDVGPKRVSPNSHHLVFLNFLCALLSSSQDCIQIATLCHAYPCTADAAHVSRLPLFNPA